MHQTEADLPLCLPQACKCVAFTACVLQGDIRVMAVMHALRCFAHHQIYTHRMHNPPLPSIPRFVINWVLLMGVQCVYELLAWRTRRAEKQHAADRAPRTKGGGSSQNASVSDMLSMAPCGEPSSPRSQSPRNSALHTHTDTNHTDTVKYARTDSAAGASLARVVGADTAGAAAGVGQMTSLTRRGLWPSVASRLQVTQERAAYVERWLDMEYEEAKATNKCKVRISLSYVSYASYV